MAKLKQYLENSWYRWASQDRQTWYAAQFQYWENVNVRDMKNWVCLSWWKVDNWSRWKDFRYFTYWWGLYTVTTDWVIQDINWTTKCTISWASWTWIYCTAFNDKVYAFIWTHVYEVTPAPSPSPWTYTDKTPAITWDTYLWALCVLNYANTYLLIWSYEKLYRMDIVLWTPTYKIVRQFDSTQNILWLTQEWNYLKIYTSDGSNTKIHYAKGTFDVEYTWLVQTVSFNSLYIDVWCVTSDQWNDYVLFRTKLWEYKLAKISWYNKVDIRWTQEWDWKKIFTWSIWTHNEYPNILARDWVLFCSMEEGIRTFTEYNWWLWWWCVEFARTSGTTHMFKYKDDLYVAEYDWWYKSSYYDMCFHPHTYQSNWFIIGRVFDWWCAWLFKKNDQATITYNMPEWTNMELSYRYDRDSFWYDKSNFLSIKKLTDVNSCYDIVVPTTPWQKDIDLLALENWDNILLENGNNIMLEDLMVCPFNKTWNLLEYRFDLSTEDNTKTPILFEHSLTYYDYMRKYR